VSALDPIQTGQDQLPTTSEDGIEFIWQAMTARYGSKWLSQWATPEQIATAKRIWSIDVGKTSRKAVEKAFYKMKDTHPTWPPTSAEFGLLCAGQFADALGIPEFDEVFRKLIEQPWRPDMDTHPIYWGILQEAGKGTAVSTMRLWTAKASTPKLRRIYDQCKRAMIFGVKYEAPRHVQVAQEENLLAQTITNEQSDESIKQNLKETGNRFLSEMRANLVHDKEVV